MTITTFDRDNLKGLRANLHAAIAEVAATYGISISLGTIRFNDGRAKMTLVATTVTTNEEKAATIVGDHYELNALSERHGLPMNLMGRDINVAGRSFTIVGAKPSRLKYPFIVTGPKGGRYKMTAKNIRIGLGA